MNKKSTNTQLGASQTRLLIILFTASILLTLLLIAINRISRQEAAVEQTFVFDSSPAPVFGLVVDQNMTVIYVEPGGAAEQAGIVLGDVLVSINDQQVQSFNDINTKASEASVNAAERGIAASLTVNRGGQMILKSVNPAPPAGRSNQATPTPVPQSQLYF